MTEAVRAQAVRLLARREHSQVELARKLEAKGHDSDVAKQVVTELACQGLQSDRRFVEAFVRSRLGRGQGERKIRADLYARGIDDATADPFMVDISWDRNRHGSPPQTLPRATGRPRRMDPPSPLPDGPRLSIGCGSHRARSDASLGSDSWGAASLVD